jgi:hypothetical protein
MTHFFVTKPTMAKFKILNSRIRVNSFGSDGRCALEVELLEGTPKCGEQLQLWDPQGDHPRASAPFGPDSTEPGSLQRF